MAKIKSKEDRPKGTELELTSSESPTKMMAVPHPKAPCSFIVDTWALKGLPYHDFGAYVDTIKLHGAFRSVSKGSV